MTSNPYDQHQLDINPSNNRGTLTHAATSDQDEVSVYSYNSTRDMSKFLHEFNGRLFNSQSDTYCLPSDDAEWIRLDKQHVAFCLGLGGLYPESEMVEQVLSPDGTDKRILDLGCGTGVWAVEMAKKFPHCRVLGVDLAPTPLTEEQVPANCQFEIDDINLELPHLYNQYDLVHARCILGGIKDYPQSVEEMKKCLKPGGMLILIDGEGILYGEDCSTAVEMARDETPEKGSWFSRLMYEGSAAALLGGTDGRNGKELLDRGFWSHPEMEHCASGSLFFPVGPWAKSEDVYDTQRLQYAGSLIRQGCLRIHRAFHPVMLKFGIPQEECNRLSANVEEELTTLSMKQYVRMQMMWGRKATVTEGDDTTPPLQPTQETLSTWNGGYSRLFVYRTQEEASAAQKKRNESVGPKPIPYVESITES